MKNEIILKDKNKIVLIVSDSYSGETIIVSKGYFENEKLTKSLNLSIWDDMSFQGFSYGNNSNMIEFEFDINVPIYFCLNRLLDKDKKLIIDDDETSQHIKKYMIIQKEEKTIKIIFVNYLEKPDIIDTFRVFIKNIGPDPRSKIEDYNMKVRLINFLRDCKSILTEEYHQVTIDEYSEVLRQKKNKTNKLKV